MIAPVLTKHRLCAATVLVMSISACNHPLPGQTGKVEQTSATATPPGQTVSVSGTIIDWTVPAARHPVPNLRLRVRAMGPTDGAVGGADLPDVVTDANGRFQIDGVPRSLLTAVVFVQTPPEAEYKFPCPFYPVGGPYPSDLPVVQASWSGDTVPGGLLVGTSVFGVVSERVNGRVLPVSDATVTLDTGLQDPPSTTSGSGFYMVCSIVGSDQIRTITVRKMGYRPVTREFIGPGGVNLEVTRE